MVEEFFRLDIKSSFTPPNEKRPRIIQPDLQYLTAHAELQTPVYRYEITIFSVNDIEQVGQSFKSTKSIIVNI